MFHSGQVPPKRDMAKAFRKTFRDIARPVHPYKEERDPPGTLALQGRHAVRGLFIAGAKAVADQFDIIAQAFTGGQKAPVRHQQGGGKVVDQRDTPKAEGRRVGQA